MNKEYTVSFVAEWGDYSDFQGFAVNDVFEPGFDMALLFHDIFEHWFEHSEFFSTDQLSQAGEVVAMGIREYLNDTSGLVYQFACYNKYQGVEWNTWTTILGQIRETAEDYSPYPNDFDFQYLDQWDGEIWIDDMIPYYDDAFEEDYPELVPLIYRAFNYGYWLGEFMFSDRLQLMYEFCLNLRDFAKEIKERYELDFCNCSNLRGATLDVHVGMDEITAEYKHWDMECTITSESFIVNELI